VKVRRLFILSGEKRRMLENMDHLKIGELSRRI